MYHRRIMSLIWLFLLSSVFIGIVNGMDRWENKIKAREKVKDDLEFLDLLAKGDLYLHQKGCRPGLESWFVTEHGCWADIYMMLGRRKVDHWIVLEPAEIPIRGTVTLRRYIKNLEEEMIQVDSMGYSIPKLILSLDGKYEYTLWPTEESAVLYAKSTAERIRELPEYKDVTYEEAVEIWHEELKKHRIEIPPGETVLVEELKYQVPPKSIDPFWMYIRERMFEAGEDHFTFPIWIHSKVKLIPSELTVTKQPLDLKALGERLQKEQQKENEEK